MISFVNWQKNRRQRMPKSATGMLMNILMYKHLNPLLLFFFSRVHAAIRANISFQDMGSITNGYRNSLGILEKAARHFGRTTRAGRQQCGIAWSSVSMLPTTATNHTQLGKIVHITVVFYSRKRSNGRRVVGGSMVVGEW